MNICRRCIVSGKVQGVFFRASTCQKASELGIKGWIRNRNDKNVEVFACGETDKLDEFIQWLWIGPDSAKVSDVSISHADVENFSDFSIRYD
jgi:acylphosphatase